MREDERFNGKMEFEQFQKHQNEKFDELEQILEKGFGGLTSEVKMLRVCFQKSFMKVLFTLLGAFTLLTIWITSLKAIAPFVGAVIKGAP